MEDFNPQHKIKIIGAGVSGLLIAIALARHGFTQIELHEKREQSVAAIRFQGLVIRDPKEFDHIAGEEVAKGLNASGATDDGIGGRISTIGTIQTLLSKEAKKCGVLIQFGSTVNQETIAQWKTEGSVISAVGSGIWGKEDGYISFDTQHHSKMAHVWSVELAKGRTPQERTMQFGEKWCFVTDREITPSKNWDILGAYIQFMTAHNRPIDPSIQSYFDTPNKEEAILMRLLSHTMMISDDKVRELRDEKMTQKGFTISTINEFQIVPRIKISALEDGVLYMGDTLGSPHPLAGLGIRRIVRSIQPIVDFIASESRPKESERSARQALLNYQLYLGSATIAAINIFEAEFSKPENWKR